MVDQLRRHEKLPGSADLIAATVQEAVNAAAGGATTLWLRLSWESEEPTLTLRTSDQALLDAVPGAAGETRGPEA